MHEYQTGLERLNDFITRSEIFQKICYQEHHPIPGKEIKGFLFVFRGDKAGRKDEFEKGRTCLNGQTDGRQLFQDSDVMQKNQPSNPLSDFLFRSMINQIIFSNGLHSSAEMKGLV